MLENIEHFVNKLMVKTFEKSVKVNNFKKTLNYIQ